MLYKQSEKLIYYLHFTCVYIIVSILLLKSDIYMDIWEQSNSDVLPIMTIRFPLIKFLKYCEIYLSTEIFYIIMAHIVVQKGLCGFTYFRVNLPTLQFLLMNNWFNMWCLPMFDMTISYKYIFRTNKWSFTRKYMSECKNVQPNDSMNFNKTDWSSSKKYSMYKCTLECNIILSINLQSGEIL